MDKPEGEAVEGILHSIAVDYPQVQPPILHSSLCVYVDIVSSLYIQAICYPFKISTNDFQCDDTAEGKERLAAIEKLVLYLHVCMCNT